MYPGPAAPDLGVFVAQIADELERQGHEVARAVLDRRGGSKLRYAELARRALAEARRFRPEVVYGHFLFPAGAAAALLFAGPAVNLPSLLTVAQVAGWRAMVLIASMVWLIAVAGGLAIG